VNDRHVRDCAPLGGRSHDARAYSGLAGTSIPSAQGRTPFRLARYRANRRAGQVEINDGEERVMINPRALSGRTLARRRGSGNAAIYVMRADGSAARVVEQSAYWDSAPDWASAR
jgi:hypothetical protein